jgi:hypothetical protein
MGKYLHFKSTCLLDIDAMQIGKIPTFRNNTSFPSSGTKSNANKQSTDRENR